MEEQKPGYEAGGAIRKLTLPDGLQVGIKNLDTILREVAELKLTDTQSLKNELLERVKTCNYVPSGAAYEYSTVLLREYQRKFRGPGVVNDGKKIEKSKTTGG